MPSITLFLNGDGVTTDWTDQAAGTTNLYQAIDEGTASPNDSDYIGCTVNNTVATFLLDNMPTDFISATSVALKIRHNCSSSKNATQLIEVSLVESDDTTLVAGPVSTNGDPLINTYTYNPSIVTSNNDTNTWNGTRLKLKVSGLSGTAQVYAAQVDLVYSNIYVGAGGILGGGTAPTSLVKSNTASGGALVGGTASNSRFLIPAISGGVLLASSGVQSFTERGSGGVILNGFSDSNFNVIGAGGALLAGSLPIDGNTYQETASGGALAATSFAPRKLIYNPVITPAGLLLTGSVEFISTGGAKAATSFAPRQAIYNPDISGGLLAGGDVMFSEIVDGGILIGGDLEITGIYNIEASGSALAASTADTSIIYTPDIIVAGVLVNGLGTITNQYEYIGSGGVTLGSSALVAKVMTNTGSSGVLAGGTFNPALIFKQYGTGGLLAGGTTIQVVGMVGSGGVKINGTASSTNIIYTNFTASGTVLCSSIAPIRIVYRHQPTDGVLIGGSANVELGFKASGGAKLNGTIDNVAFMNHYPSGGVILNNVTSVGIITTVMTNTNNVSVKVGGECDFFYTMIRALSPDECIKTISCVNDEFEPKKPKPHKYNMPYASCKKTIILRGGFVPSTTVCTLGFKVKELINQNQDISKGPAQRTSEPTVEIS